MPDSTPPATRSIERRIEGALLAARWLLFPLYVNSVKLLGGQAAGTAMAAAHPLTAPAVSPCTK